MTIAVNIHETDMRIVHPLFDVPEMKKDADAAGPMEMTPSVKWSLITLRVYLLLIMGLAFYRVIASII